MTMDVAEATRPGREDEDDEALAPFWRISDGLGGKEAQALSQRILGRMAVQETMAPGVALPFAASSVLTTRPELGLMSCFHPAGQWRWPDAAIGQTGYLLLRPADGRVMLEHDGRRITLRAREALIVEAGSAMRFTLVQVGRLDLVRLDSDRLEAFIGLLEPRLMQPVSRDNRALQVLANYGALLLRGLLPLNSVELQTLAIDHIHHLIGAMLRDRSPALPANVLDRRAARLGAVKADIETRLERRDLSIETIAGLYGVTARSIQKLFESEARTFSEYVLERRLERAWYKLIASDTPKLSISSVAFETGFGDLSYFNRSFRKRFGQSPSQVRLAQKA
ncbi:helix-turn-helix transcriptional regulator [Bosea sp. (in: a-proteobacteria)]|jgi:AraC-like DNA-binding protein|uniref:helix-turn-helix transcriptional regulator n=1 Tax=Bosea sp. (in: a-proteobacteria) TaxID=1871050 RepID=UPI003F72508E